MDQGSSPVQGPEVPLAAAASSARSLAAAGTRKKPLSFRLKDYGGSFLFVLPYLIFFTFFLLGPLLYALYVSVHEWQTIGGNKGYVGFRHYHRILFESGSISFEDFWRGMRNTGFFVIVSVPILVAFPLTLALLLANGPFRDFFRAVFYLPAILSVTVAMTIWLWIFQPTGIINGVFHTNTQWLTTASTAWFVIILSTVWWTIGFNMVVLLAAVIEVPNDYHEAARIDGANALQRVWYITIPVIRPILAFVTITQTLASFGLFGQPFILTGGGPQHATEPIIYTIYNKTFGPDQDIGTASAMSFILGAILVAVSLVILRFFKTNEA
ncbi:MAG: sugar ABC transporter permease [Chloroflexota bacterium]